MKNAGLIADIGLLLLAKNVDFGAAVADYQKKLGGRVTLTTIKTQPHLPTAERGKKETAAILAHVKRRGGTLIALDQGGALLSSANIATQLEQLQQEHRHIYFLIGGADGIAKETLTHCRHIWSFGLITYPHGFMPLLLLEQLFRADSILRGTPYHIGH
ncbi:MAG: 23S rRNA (pseudouridine(1915)-N(3))-methyltransferase RlmH [Alphaproteobacteria bacterium]|nr:23S rRNA (pseudouridine(1915)-N(3))-methyltransferase RlmH [Alphaproteobacteria bacterium]